MAKLYTIALTACLLFGLAYAEPSRQHVRVRFPGPVKITQLPTILANQQSASAPYPPAGLKPDPPFELPTEEIYGPPDQTYGPPDQSYGPPDQNYGPPDQTYGAPDQTYAPPEQIYSPPDQIYWPPEQAHGSAADNNALPYAQRLIVFRPLRRPAPQRRPPNSLLSANIIPQTQFTLPLTERLTVFRPIRRPTAFRNPNFKPTKFNRPQQPKPIRVSVGSRPQQPKPIRISVGTVPQQNFAQLPPIIRNPILTGNRIIAYSDRLQSW